MISRIKPEIMNMNKIDIIEFILYLIGGISLSVFGNKIVLYLAFLFTCITSLIRYKKQKKISEIHKILLLSVIIPNNYIIIGLFVIFLLYFLVKKSIILDKKIVLLSSFILVLGLLNNFKIPNFLFGIVYLSGIIISNILLRNSKEEASDIFENTVCIVKRIIIIELIVITIYFAFHITEVLSAIDNDWLVGTFGYLQGNIFLYFIFFSILLLKEHYTINKEKIDLLYLAICAILAILTNSIALIIMFIVAYFMISFIHGSIKHKIGTFIILIIIVSLFALITPDWIRSYLIKLTNPKYFVTNIAKVQTYKDTFWVIPSRDVKFLIIGNGIGEYSSRAALTCTGEYVKAYKKMFSPSISEYSDKYIYNKYIKYNINEKQGTMYSPFSTIISIQGEYGLIGLCIFIIIICIAIKKSSKTTRVFIIFFLLSCLIENYLEFAKISYLLMFIYYILNNNKKVRNN